MRFLIIPALFSASLFAQISGLATSDHGDQLLFMTTRLRQTGSEETSWYQIFKLSAGDLTRIDANDEQQFAGLSISGDGSVVAVSMPSGPREGCQIPCISDNEYRLEYPGGESTGDGTATLTPNGRYAIVKTQKFGEPIQVGDMTRTPIIVTVSVVEVSSGTVVRSGSAAGFGSGRLAADDGSLLVRTEAGVQLVGPGGTMDLPGLPPPVGSVFLAADASTIAYQVPPPEPGPGSQIGLYDVASGRNTVVGMGRDLALANNGTLASFTNVPADPGAWPHQIWVADPASGEARMLATFDEGLQDQTITGDARSVIVATQTGRIVSVDVASGEQTELVGRTGPTMGLIRSAVPGSYNELGVAEQIRPDLADVHLTVDGHAAPVLGTTIRGISVQIPWEARPQPDPSGKPVFGEVILNLGDPRFEEVVPAPVVDHYVYFLPIAQDSLAGPWYFAAHEDWKSVVKYDNPAHAGEIIHMYSMGWGPVDGTLQTGQPTPTDRFYKIAAPCTWSAYSAHGPNEVGEPLEALFSGLAPGLTGLFQQDFRVPENWSHDRLLVACGDYFGPDPVFAVPTQP